MFVETKQKTMTREGKIKVYFEKNADELELIAIFEKEELYLHYFPKLERLAKKLGFTLLTTFKF